jgi:radical SAM protein with 4Fe4S-binding SPASM domain
MKLESRIKHKWRELSHAAEDDGWLGAARYFLRELDQICFKLKNNYINAAAPRRFPIQVDIEASGVCNLKCPSCPRSHDGSSSAGWIEPNVLETILDKMPFRPKDVLLGGVGEPLANPHLDGLIDVMARRGIECRMFTNGTLLNASSQNMLLSHRNLRSVGVSIDGATKESFEQLRRGANFEKWKEHVQSFCESAALKRGRSFIVSTNTVVSKYNINEIPDIISLVAGLGVKHMQLIDMIPAEDEARDMVAPIAQYDSIIGMVKDIERQFDLHIIYSRRRFQFPPKVAKRCMLPWSYILVKANGDIEGCCALFGRNGKPVMGNILKQSFEEIWHGEAFREFRIGSTKGTNAMCNLCPYY